MMHQYYPSPPQHDYAFELNKDITFAAAHFVPHPEAGKCQRQHGHTYVVNITIVGNQLNDAGFLVDFRTLKHLVENRYDHTVLNDHDEFNTDGLNSKPDAVFPTTETVARQIWKTIQDHLDTEVNKCFCLQVLVRETPESYVLFRPARGGYIGS